MNGGKLFSLRIIGENWGNQHKSFLDNPCSLWNYISNEKENDLMIHLFYLRDNTFDK